MYRLKYGKMSVLFCSFPSDKFFGKHLKEKKTFVAALCDDKTFLIHFSLINFISTGISVITPDDHFLLFFLVFAQRRGMGGFEPATFRSEFLCSVLPRRLHIRIHFKVEHTNTKFYVDCIQLCRLTKLVILSRQNSRNIS